MESAIATVVSYGVIVAVLAYYLYISYLFRHKEFVDDVKRKVQYNLSLLQNEFKSDVKLAKYFNDKVDEAVQDWIVMVDKVRGEMAELHHQAGEIHNCFQGWGLACYNFAKTLNQKNAIIEELLVQGRSFPAYVPRLLLVHFQVLPSRRPTMKKVIEALMDENNDLVGIYGMAGVGKTAFVRQVCYEVETSKLFDKVVLATVSQDTDMIGIRTQVAEGLGIRLEESSIPVRASRITAWLKMQNKVILLILEDVWEKLDLADIGIDVSENKCKVLVISRNSGVCRSMKTTINIHVKLLSYDDSFDLFRHEVGDEYSNAKYFEMSEKIVRKCAGLPLAITTLARSLRGKGDGVWYAVCHQLVNSVYEHMDLVNSSIKLSYDFLGTKETKLCFLLCALFPENYVISMDPLIGYVLGEGLLGDPKSLEEARECLTMMLDTLVSSGLLLKEWNEGTMMHPIFRDTAILIACSENNEWIIRAGMGLLQWPKVKSESVLRMSLMSNNIQKIPDAPDYSKLVTLSLASNSLLKEIPDEFFGGATWDWESGGIEDSKYHRV